MLRELVLLAALAAMAAAHVMPLRERTDLFHINKNQMFQVIREAANDPKNRAVSCSACTLMVDGVQVMLLNNKTDTEIQDFLINACIALNLQQPHACRHIIYEYTDEVLFVLERVVITPDEICGSFIKDCGTPNAFHDMWKIDIPGVKPPVNPYPTVPDGKTYKVLHLSDIHIDRIYAVGTEADCQDDGGRFYQMCCEDFQDDVYLRQYSVKKDQQLIAPAGPWGMNYGCDIPFQTFDSAMRHISTTHTDLTYIIITGDFESHNIWDYTQQATTDNVHNITDVLLKYFPTTPIYVAIGNHEGVPMDAMAPHGMAQYKKRGPQWLYSLMKEMWGHWIPTEALDTVQYRASYAIRPQPGLKLISINTVYCSHNNFYLYINQTDPDDTVEWLIQQLQESEDKNEVVHIISHIPPGDDYCLPGWSWNFYQVVKRFENTIAEMFFGHTHKDHFQVYYDYDDPHRRAFHNNWISPSLTTYSYLNPSYRIYDIDGGYDGATYKVKDARTYYGNVTEANNNNKEPNWQLLYSHRDAYGMKDFSPDSWSDLSDRLLNDADLFKSWMLHYYRNEHNVDCYKDVNCRKDFVCAMKTSRSYDKDACVGM